MQNNAKTENRFRWLKLLLLAMLIFASGSTLGLVLGAASSLSTWNLESLAGSQSTTLLDKNGEAFASLFAEENRVQVPLSKIPPNLINAFVATEDENFYQHHGINITSVIRAILIDIATGSKAQGGSTITQQLARNAFLSPEKTVSRKIKEAVIAITLENRYSKDEIMEFYLNRIYFGSGAWGVQTAAQTYFGKNVDDLNLAECALITGLVQRPTAYSPYRNYDMAKKRQRVVLNRMVACGFITQEEAEKTYNQPLYFVKPVSTKSRYGYFTDYVIDEVDRILRQENLFDDPQNAIFKGGLKVYTTLDPDIQKRAEEVFANPSYFPLAQSKTGQTIQSALAVVENQTGAISALIGGRSYDQQRGFNRATEAFRQPGSAFKPLVVYGPALEAGFSPDYVLEDSPVTFNFGGTTWSPQNYDGKYRGNINMRTAVAYSVNTYAVKLADIIGIGKGIEFAKKCGITSLVESGRLNDYNLSTALGGITKGVSPLEMASAYSTFGNGGVHAAPYAVSKIVDSSGKIIYQHQPRYVKAMKPETAWNMTMLLKAVVEYGTGTRARISGISCAGKTGTTQNDNDAWFVGYTPTHSCAVWMGYDLMEPMNRAYGGSYPALIWKAVMSKAFYANEVRTNDFQVPDNLVSAVICTKSGKLASPACPQKDIALRYFDQDSVPVESCDLHIMINICPESGLLSTQFCPHPTQRAYSKDAPPGTPEAAPTHYCTIHSFGDGNGSSNMGGSTNQDPVLTGPQESGPPF